jgi:hypothetical protein
VNSSYPAPVSVAAQLERAAERLRTELGVGTGCKEPQWAVWTVGSGRAWEGHEGPAR